MKRYAKRYRLKIRAWRLRTHHVHLIAEPEGERTLSLTLGHGHGKYAQWINSRHGFSGHLWKGRFVSTALDEEHLWAAARYLERNPVRAGLFERAEE